MRVYWWLGGLVVILVLVYFITKRVNANNNNKKNDNSCQSGCKVCVDNYGSPSTYCDDPDCITPYYGTPCDACETLFGCDSNDCEDNAGCEDDDKWWANFFDSIFGHPSQPICSTQLTPTQVRELLGRGMQNSFRVCQQGDATQDCSKVSDADFQNWVQGYPVLYNYVLVNQKTAPVATCKTDWSNPETFLKSGPVANQSGPMDPGMQYTNTVNNWVGEKPLDRRSIYFNTTTKTFWKHSVLLKKVPFPIAPNVAFYLGSHQIPTENVPSGTPDYVNTTGSLLDTLGWAWTTLGNTQPWYIATIRTDKGPNPQFSAYIVQPTLMYPLQQPWYPNKDFDTYSFQPQLAPTPYLEDVVLGLWRTLINPEY
jgi:hypothetical protein